MVYLKIIRIEFDDIWQKYSKCYVCMLQFSCMFAFYQVFVFQTVVVVVVIAVYTRSIR